MSVPRKPGPAKLVISVFLKNKDLMGIIAERLATEFGALDVVSPWYLFSHTDYYASELGSPLYRRLLAFCRLVEQDQLPDVKLFTNTLEQEFSEQGKRRVNIDPGHLVAERFVLATGKNYSHRVYLRDGIYADLTFIYRKSAYQRLEWTYPDYAEDAIHGFLQKIRKRYLRQVVL
ncbi:MAG: DUF4416 family protein [Pseudomonadota bacterium]